MALGILVRLANPVPEDTGHCVLNMYAFPGERRIAPHFATVPLQPENIGRILDQSAGLLEEVSAVIPVVVEFEP